MSSMLSSRFCTIHGLVLILLSLFLLPSLLSAQESIRGRIFDKKTGEALPFVNIVYNSRGQGIVSGIDGSFEIKNRGIIEFLEFSYVGYHGKLIPSEDIRGRNIRVELEQTSYKIEEVIITPGINPAHRIIHEVLHNRKRNDPEELNSFSYNSYNKFLLTANKDSLSEIKAAYDLGKDSLPQTKADSSIVDLLDFFDKQHLFIMESVSERKFLHPGRNKELILASRVSGFQDPSFALLATQLQSFSFYKNVFNIFDKKYLNPISPGSTSKYYFEIRDTLFTEEFDTVFIITCRPFKNRNFDGLTGVLQINSRNYAIQNVLAEASEPQDAFRVSIQQNYRLIDSLRWFPAQLNTRLYFKNATISAGGKNLMIIGKGITYLYDIQINPDLNRKDFDNIALSTSPEAWHRSPEEWNQYRYIPLDSKDTATYKMIDSLGKESNFDRVLNILEAISTGYVPLGYFQLNYLQLINYNQYEGWRLGLELETSKKMSGLFTLGGFFAYGFRDEDWKYGGKLEIHPFRDNYQRIGVSAGIDTRGSGGIRYIEKPSVLSSEFYRDYLVSRLDLVEYYSFYAYFRASRHFSFKPYYTRENRLSKYEYVFGPIHDTNNLPARTENKETGLSLKFAFKEQFIDPPRGNKISLGTDFPKFLLNISYGSIEDYEDYRKFTARLSQRIRTRALGETSITAEAGLVDQSALPAPYLFYNPGSYERFTIETVNSFASMRLNEFLSDRYLHLFFRHNFGYLLFRAGNFKPDIILAHHMGWGSLENTSLHEGISFKTMDKGFLESGILLNNLIRAQFLGYGIGVYYRYGPYSLQKTIDNFAFKFSVSFNL